MEYFRNPTSSAYRKKMSNPLALSYSTRRTLHACPRRFELDKLKNADVFSEDEQGGLQDNIDFAYGSSLAAGIQQCLIKRDRTAIIFSAWVAWDTELLASKPDKRKSFSYVVAALDNFLAHYQSFMGNWELATLNGKPAVELSVRVDLDNGYYYYLHIDGVLRHKVSGKFLILELKTTGFNNIHPAIFQNSDQALGYSIVLDSLVEDKDNLVYEVLYLVYKTSRQEFEPMFFTKRRLERISWIRNLLFDCEDIEKFKAAKHFPQRDSGCYSYFRACPYFEMCGMRNSSLTKYSALSDMGEGELAPADFEVSLQQIINDQAAMIGG